jgi:hypothetical protein
MTSIEEPLRRFILLSTPESSRCISVRARGDLLSHLDTYWYSIPYHMIHPVIPIAHGGSRREEVLDILRESSGSAGSTGEYERFMAEPFIPILLERAMWHERAVVMDLASLIVSLLSTEHSRGITMERREACSRKIAREMTEEMDEDSDEWERTSAPTGAWCCVAATIKAAQKVPLLSSACFSPVLVRAIEEETRRSRYEHGTPNQCMGLDEASLSSNWASASMKGMREMVARHEGSRRFACLAGSMGIL